MPDYDVSIEVDGDAGGRVDAERLRQAAEQTLIAQDVVAPAELSVVITGDERVRDLNRQYRDEDRETDVLAFALSEAGDGQTFVVAPDGVMHLGEVVVSSPQAGRQARELGHSLEEELTLLVVHGVLHLLGFDDQEPGDAQRMRVEESRILDSLRRQR